jgi:hypothetical protein
MKRTINAIKYSATWKMKVQYILSLLTKHILTPRINKKLRTEYVVMEPEICSNIRRED